MEKFATEEGTSSFFSKFKTLDDKQDKVNGLTFSALGIGTYLGDPTDEVDLQYVDSIKHAVRKGVNHLDTAINYRSQRSEKVIGKSVKELQDEGILRSNLIISTKGGFLCSEDSPETFTDYVKKEYLDTGLIKEEDIIENSYCLTSPFIDTQIEKSLENMNLDSIDIYYVHNPEILLFHLSEEEFYQRLKEIFTLLEEKVVQGKIQSYGLATWSGFRQKRGSKGFLDLVKIEAAAKKVNIEHHFRYVQLPYNLIMLECINLKNQLLVKEKLTFLECANRLNIQTISSAPLMQSYVKNLPKRIFDFLPGGHTEMQKALEFVLSTRGITSTLVGMKSSKHLKENLDVLKIPAWDQEEYEKALKFLTKGM